MKATKLNTSIALITAMIVGVVLVDTFAGIKGPKGRLVNGLRSSLIGNSEKKDKADSKLSEMSESIASLIKRISKVEESLAKLDGKFEKKLVFPAKPEKAFGDFGGEANLEVFGFESNGKDKRDGLFSIGGKPEDIPLSFVSVPPSAVEVQRQLNFIRNVEASMGYMGDQDQSYDISQNKKASKEASMGYIENQGYESSREKKASKKHHPQTFKRHEREHYSKRHEDNQFDYDVDRFNDNRRKESFNDAYFAKDFKKRTPETSERVINEHLSPSKKEKVPVKTHDKEFFPVPLKPFNPLSSSAKVEKLNFSAASKNSVPILHADPSKPIDFSEIFPDLSKDDPIVEVKRFDDYNSFKNYGESIKGHKHQIEDGSVDTKYFNMSEILNSDKKPAVSGIKMPALFENKKPALSETKKPILDLKKPESAKENLENIEKAINSLGSLKTESADSYKITEKSSGKKACEEFADPEEAFRTGMCLYKGKEEVSQSKKAKAAEASKEVEKPKIEKVKLEIVKEASTDKAELKAMKEAENSKPEIIIVEEIKAEINEKPELQISPDEKYIKDNQIDKNIQTSFGDNEKYNSHNSDMSSTKNRSSKIDKAEEEDSLLEMIGTKLSKKINDRNDDSIQQPSTSGPVV